MRLTPFWTPFSNSKRNLKPKNSPQIESVCLLLRMLSKIKIKRQAKIYNNSSNNSRKGKSSSRLLMFLYRPFRLLNRRWVSRDKNWCRVKVRVIKTKVRAHSRGPNLQILISKEKMLWCRVMIKFSNNLMIKRSSSKIYLPKNRRKRPRRSKRQKKNKWMLK